METAFLVICGVSWAISFVCLLRLWRRGDAALRKLAWSVLLLLPIFGPLLYGALYRPPPVQPEALRAPFDVSRHTPG